MDKLLAEEKMEIFKAKMLKRDRERRQVIKENREKKEQNMVSTEQVSYFADTFTQKRHEIECAMNAADLGQVDKNQLPSHFDKISKDIQILERFTSDSTLYLQEHDICKSKEALQSLRQKCQELEKRLLPKKKFGFKIKKDSCNTRKESFLQKIEDTVDSISVPMLPFKALCGYTENSCGFSGRTEENLSLPHEVICKKDVLLTNLVGCTVKLIGSPGTLHMASLHNCRIMCGPVARSVFIDDCADCTFLLACQQLRIHNTKHCDIYSHISSRTIIEDSTQVGFAPYNWKYENMEHHFKIAGLDININNWNLVDDFNWLASDEPSPNWHILKADEMKDDWI